MSTSTDREDVDTWAPVGWEPSDPGFDEAPFGSVLGDPLMGSPLFDVAVLDDPSEHRPEDRKTARGGRAASAERAQSDPTAALRAQAEEQVRAMRRGIPQNRQTAPRSSGYGRTPGGRPGAAASGQRPQARQPARPAQQPARMPAPVPQSPYNRRPGSPVGYGGGPGGPMGYGGASGAPGRPPGSGLPQRAVGSGRPAPAAVNPYALPGVDGRPGQARPPQLAGSGQKKGIGPYVGWIIFFLVFIIWRVVR